MAQITWEIISDRLQTIIDAIDNLFNKIDAQSQEVATRHQVANIIAGVDALSNDSDMGKVKKV